MNKQFDIIPIEDYGVVVDKEAGQCYEIGKIAFAYQFGIVSKIMENIGGSNRDVILEKMPHNGTLDRRQLYPVIASINKRIDDIPLIEIHEVEIQASKLKIAENAEAWIYNQLSESPKEDIEFAAESCTDYWKAGYKAATKKYSEEDMVNFATNVFNMYEDGDLTIKARKKDTNFYNLSKEMIKSLQPKLPKSVVLEMEEATIGSEIYINKAIKRVVGGELIYQVKITNPETNTITPKEVKYE